MKVVTTKTKTDFPVSLNEAKNHLRLDADFVDDDGYINSIIKGATREAENYIGKDIALTSCVQKLYGINTDTFRIWEGFLNSVTSVLDVNGGSQTIGVTKTFENSFEIQLTSSTSTTTDFDFITINYVTGFAQENVPEEIKQAILIKVANMYDLNREDATPRYLADQRNSTASNNLLNAHKQILF